MASQNISPMLLLAQHLAAVRSMAATQPQAQQLGAAAAPSLDPAIAAAAAALAPRPGGLTASALSTLLAAQAQVQAAQQAQAQAEAQAQAQAQAQAAAAAAAQAASPAQLLASAAAAALGIATAPPPAPPPAPAPAPPQLPPAALVAPPAPAGLPLAASGLTPALTTAQLAAQLTTAQLTSQLTAAAAQPPAPVLQQAAAAAAAAAAVPRPALIPGLGPPPPDRAPIRSGPGRPSQPGVGTASALAPPAALRPLNPAVLAAAAAQQQQPPPPSRPRQAPKEADVDEGRGGAGSSALKSAEEDAEKAKEKESTPEVPRCHLHRKANKACKFCKAYTAFVEEKAKEEQERKNKTLEKLQRDNGSKGAVDAGAKVPLPNLAQFPQVMKERLLNYRYYNQVLANQELTEVKEALYTCDSCEPESRGTSTLDMMPSTFFCCMYRLMNLKITEGQMQSLLNNRSRWVRCATFLLIRFGVAQERYWELLHEHLMEDEEFIPFPSKGGDTMTEGQFVQELLTKEKYCELQLPRIAVAQRKLVNERLVLYDQFRRRYAANMDVLDRYENPNGGVHVEVCDADGEWYPAETVGARSPGRKRVTVPVRLKNKDSDVQMDVSMGMCIFADKEGSSSSSSRDLTRSRGRSNKELLEEFRRSQREGAVASGKDYCKNSGRHTIHAGGVTFICGDGQDKRKKESDSEEEDRLYKRRKEEGQSREHQAKMAAIMEKYCAAPGRSSASRSDENRNVDRMRLG